jgi:ribosomal protein S18 acetylase RimI-like enzyme
LPEQFIISLPVTIRSCRPSDLPDLEWFGLLTEYRQTITEAFQRFQKGEILMLVAEVNHFPAGQLWVDLTKQREESVGVLWALRVFIPFQDLGIGTRLIQSAEEGLKGLGFRISELAVEKDNPDAQRLYERMGYRVVRENIEEWGCIPSASVRGDKQGVGTYRGY